MYSFNFVILVKRLSWCNIYTTFSVLQIKQFTQIIHKLPFANFSYVSLHMLYYWYYISIFLQPFLAVKIAFN